MKYVAILNQGQGCHYTIGCGIKAIEFEAADVVDAHRVLNEIVKQDYNYDETRLQTLVFYPTNNTKHIVDVSKWYEEFQIEHNKQIEEDVKKKELEELQRLQEKYGTIQKSR